MPRWNLERKLVAAVVLLFIIPTAVAGAILLVLYRRGVLDEPRALLLTVLVGGSVMMLYLGTMAHGIGRWLVRTLQEIRTGTELMATVHPTHRLAISTGDELEALSQEVNRLADHLHAARTGLEAEVARTTQELHTERSKLSAVIGGVDEGVVVATLDGLVTLANPAAHALLGAPRGGILGRSLFDFVDREKVVHFLERLQPGQPAGERFTLHPAGGAVLLAGMTPFPDAEGRTTGFILTLRDVSRPSDHEERRQQMLSEVLFGLRGSLASIRSLSESLLADPALAGDRAPLVEAIHAEAVRLSGVVTGGTGGSLMERAGAPWRFEEVTVGDLLALGARRLARQGGDVSGVRVEVPSPDLRLRVEASSLSAVLAHLMHAVLERRRPGGDAWVRAVQRGRVLQLEAGADGTRAAAELEAALDAPVTVGMVGSLPVREIVKRHSGEVWAWAGDADGGFRLSLPLVGARNPGADPHAGPAGAALVGAGLLSGAGPGDAGTDGHGLYDFSFFDEMERALTPADRERPLETLTVVVLDTETTGLGPDDGDRIVSLAGVRLRNGAVKRSELFDALVNPGRPIPQASTRFHGITDAMVARAPGIDVVLPAFLRFAGGAALAGHEVWFDLRFLSRETAQLALAPLTESHAILDTRLLSQLVHGGEGEHDLDSVARRLGVPVQGRHSALGDALVTAEVLARLLPLLGKRGIVTLGQALGATRAARGREARP